MDAGTSRLHAHVAGLFGQAPQLEIGRPWIFGAEADRLPVPLPYSHGPSPEEADAVQDVLAIAWLMPIHTCAADFARIEGAEALEQCFETAAQISRSLAPLCDVRRAALWPRKRPPAPVE